MERVHTAALMAATLLAQSKMPISTAVPTAARLAWDLLDAVEKEGTERLERFRITKRSSVTGEAVETTHDVNRGEGRPE